MMRTLRGWSAGAALAAALTTAGCAGTGWDDVLNGGGTYGYGSDIRGEVRGVGSRSIEVRTQGGRQARVLYDRNTDVRDRDRRYSVRSLERGDMVTIRTRRGRDGDLYARSVIVNRSRTDRVAERRVPPRRDEAYARTTLDGRVGRVDRRGARFELRDTRQGTVWVSLPRNASRGMHERVSRLREGQRVRLQGRFLSNNRFEALGFR